ncbi:ShlB/FhaC/HecB family hemolysin secretion/activation protein [Psychrobacter sp. M13]|uniref:ShlB/FhaC/HecB family hemolysin secretion/activation protein n=1 Tax=Psychrobacter sp. M13 TaxID=3067275 RepID=UPI00273AA209|nr:ShlB/FhaC/HecB family hemolysin secretion/activation protein [Psychrobacter sp. M13]WLP94211.1 ShlB/FhaC/HecB family hemolysin secretion/activation protein [Psychrobacter sp. M13]
MLIVNRLKFLLIPTVQLCVLGIISFSVYAETDINQIEQQQFNQYQQRIENIEDRIAQPFVSLDKSTQTDDLLRVPLNETPCFNIYKVELVLPDKSSLKRQFATILGPIKYGRGSILGKCIGQQGLNYAVRNVQNELIKQGFITSQASLLAQDLTTGTLEITIIPGRLDKVWRGKDGHPNVNVSNALVLDKGDIINLRDIETSLENFRLPQSHLTTIDIVPSINATDNEQYGSSDLVVTQKRANRIQWQLGIDDSGNKDTGQYQGTISATIDRPLASNDVLNLSYTHTIDPWNNVDSSSNNESIYANYRYPYKNWQLQLTYSDYGFDQTLAGLNDDIIYRGRSDNSAVDLQRIIHRDSESKTIATVGGYHGNSKNFFDDIEIEVQRRRFAGWKAGINHQRQTALGEFNASLQYQRGTGAFSAIQAPESFISEAESQPSVWEAQFNLRSPFYISNASYQYNLQWRGQYSPDILIPQDRFSIGGRYTLKGSSEEQSLSGEKGMLLQQEIARILPLPNQMTLMPYFTLDQGWVDGDSTQFLAGKYLVSTSFGARLYSSNISIDGFIGKSLQAPSSFDKDTVGGFRVTVYN